MERPSCGRCCQGQRGVLVVAVSDGGQEQRRGYSARCTCAAGEQAAAVMRLDDLERWTGAHGWRVIVDPRPLDSYTAEQRAAHEAAVPVVRSWLGAV